MPMDAPRRTRIGPLALLPLLVSACALQAGPGPITGAADSDATSTDVAPRERIVKLENGSYLEIKPGTDPGFTHCCGDEGYMMEMDCSERLMRCYENRGTHWKQTYGKHCKRNLDQECYLQTCNAICEAIDSVGGQL